MWRVKSSLGNVHKDGRWENGSVGWRVAVEVRSLITIDGLGRDGWLPFVVALQGVAV